MKSTPAIATLPKTVLPRSVLLWSALPKAILLILASTFSINAQAAIIGGIDFPDGALSFADMVVSYAPGADVGSNGSGDWSNPDAA